MLTVYLTLRDVAQILTRLGDIPPMARHLIAAVVIMGIFLLRNLLMLLMLSAAMDASAAGKFLVGRAIMLLTWVRLSRPMRAVFKTCSGPKVGGQGCLRLAGLFPKLPRPPQCLLRGVGEEVLGVGIEAVLAAAGITGETSFGKVDVAMGAGGALLECAGSENGRTKKEVHVCANSFDGATEVLMADGTEKRIDEVEVGDKVWSEDPETSDRGPRKVTNLIVGEGLKRLVAVTIATALGLATITATDGHPFWVDSRSEWVDAGDLRPDDLLETPEGRQVRVLATRAFEDQHRVYNLTVDDLHTYFVAANGESVLVHNQNDFCHSLYEPRIDAGTGKQMTIDTSGFTGNSVTPGGGVHNLGMFWRRWRDEFGYTLSPANKRKASYDKAPIIDETWVQTFPEHKPWLGYTLIHHHVDCGAYAMPVPKPVHERPPGRTELHRNCRR